MNIIVVHPGKQHSYYLAEALARQNELSYYITTVYNKHGSLTNRFGKLLKGDNRKRFLTRKNIIFDDKVIQFCELRGLILLMLYRIKPNSIITVKLEKQIHDLVYKKAIIFASKRNIDALIVYGGFTDNHIKLKNKIAPKLKIIVDVPIATNEYMCNVFEQDIVLTGEEVIRQEQQNTFLFSNKDRIPLRYLSANGFLVGSTFVKKSLEYLGSDEKKIRVVPYGVDTSIFNLKEFTNLNEKVKFIFVGQVNRRKGIHHLLSAFSRLNPNMAELIVVGKYDEQDELINKYMKCSNIYFKGFVTKDVVANLYKEANVFVLPSLGEGLAQVGIEAMSCGLPVIVSNHTGLNDLIIHGKEGFIIPVSNTQKLYESMQWYVDHKNEIEKMGKLAHNTAIKYTWLEYEKNVYNAINDLLINSVI